MATPATDADSAIAANARFFRVLGDPTRLAILSLLLKEPHSVSEIARNLQVPQGRVSNHLACLRWCCFVTTERRGRSIIYSVADGRLEELLALVGTLTADTADHLASCHRIGPDWV
jgi:DNA-binding transcriptional ArsR family regulator